MSDDPRNIVMVSIDSLQGDHCGYLGDDRGLTPTLDRMADEGVAYENAVAPGPQTFSSMPAVMTESHRRPTTLDEYPQATHWKRRLAAVDDYLRRNATLAEHLSEAGYDTAGVTPNPWTSRASGFDRGFDHFEDFSEGATSGFYGSLAERLPGVDHESRGVELVVNMLSGSEFFARWERLEEEVQRVRASLSEPYFLWVFILDTHFPFLPSRTHREEQSLLGTYYSAYRSAERMRGNGDSEMPTGVRRSLERSYRDTVRASDAFLDSLEGDLAADDPAFVVHSDHGESFGGHGNYGHHHGEVYEENVHVPLVVHNAGTRAIVRDPTSLASIHETTLGIAKNGNAGRVPGASEFAVTKSECGTNRAVRGRRFKYVVDEEGGHLYDLGGDPGERTDVAAAHPDQCERLREVLGRHESHVSETSRLQQATGGIASQSGI